MNFKFNHIIHSILFSILVFSSAFAQTNLSLSEAVELGLKNNYQIQIATQQKAIADNNNNWNTAGRYPTVDVRLNGQNAFSNVNNPASFIAKSNNVNSDWTAVLEGNYVLFDGYKVRITKRRLEALTEQSDGNLKVAIENNIQAIMLAYYQALIQKEQLDVSQQVLDLSRDRIRQQEIRKEFGQASTFDILQTQDAYLNDSTTYLVQTTNYENALRQLNLSMGLDDLNTFYQLSDILTYTPQDYGLAALEEQLFSKNQNLQNLFIQRNLANVETQLQNTNRYPRISATAGLSQSVNVSYIDAQNPFSGEDFGTNTGRTFRGYINLSASYNLYNGGNTKRAIENAQLQELVTQLNIDELKRNLSAQLATTLANYNNQKRLYELTNNLLINAEQNLDIGTQRFKAGQINSFDYRAIQLSFINAAQRRLNAIFNLKNTETELVKLIGGLVR